MYKDILNKIKEYDIITIFRHGNPDGDAVGSQLGLKTWILDNFKEKKVFALGEELYDVYPFSDVVDDETVKKSLAIVLDTANVTRIDDSRYLSADYLIKIDHHPNKEPFGDLLYVDEKAAAACEILTDILFSFDEYTVSDTCAKYLFSGLLTDTLSFTTTNTSKNTFKAASLLLSTNIKPNEIASEVFSINLDQFKAAAYVKNNFIYDDGVAYTIVDRNTIEEYGLKGSDFRNRITELGNVKEFKIWCVFTLDSDGIWHGSLRSRGVTINEVASRYNGGGHANACGVKFESIEDINRLIKELKTLIMF